MGAVASFEPGDVIASRFKVVEPLGSSEGGIAYLVQETEKKRRMVLKHLAVPYVGDEGYEELRREIKDASSIRHKNILQVYGLGKEQEELFLAMEYVDGETLDRHLRNRRLKGQFMSLKGAYNLVAHLCNALQVVHDAGVVHGALTTRNIYITRQGRVKIANLVYAKLVSSRLAADKLGAFFDSPFIAPEAAQGLALTPAADVYSTGLLTAEILSEVGREEWAGSTEEFVEQVVNGRSAGMQELLFGSVVQVPQARMQSIREFKAGLKDAVDAPSDFEFSSVVLGASELQDWATADNNIVDDEDVPAVVEKKKDIFDLPDLPPTAEERSMELDLATVVSLANSDEDPEIWLVQKDGLDYGPFTRQTILDMLHKDEIAEGSSVLNMLTQRRADLVDVGVFRADVLKYIPVREERRAREAKERERKVAQVKTGAKFSAAGVIVTAVVITSLSVIAYLQLPDPVPVEFPAAISAFPHTFEVPKIEEITLNVDTSQTLAIFDPDASDAEREAALEAWRLEHEKRIEAERKKGGGGKRRGKPRGAAGGTTGVPGADDNFDENVDTLAFGVDENGEELETLQDWEVEEQLYSSRALRKQSECLQGSGHRGKITVDFVIVQNGQVRKITTTASGELDACLKSVFRSMRFREFGGTLKKVSYPINFG